MSDILRYQISSKTVLTDGLIAVFRNPIDKNDLTESKETPRAQKRPWRPKVTLGLHYQKTDGLMGVGHKIGPCRHISFYSLEI